MKKKRSLVSIQEFFLLQTADYCSAVCNFGFPTEAEICLRNGGKGNMEGYGDDTDPAHNTGPKFGLIPLTEQCGQEH